MKFLHPGAVINVDKKDAVLNPDCLRACRYVLSNDSRPQGEYFLFPESLLESDGFEDGWKEVADPRESLAHTVKRYRFTGLCERFFLRFLGFFEAVTFWIQIAYAVAPGVGDAVY